MSSRLACRLRHSSRQLSQRRLVFAPSSHVHTRSYATEQQHQRSPPNQASQSSGNGRTVDFGFENISEALKAGKVREVFSSVASSYDTMNDLMSLGIHRLWKDEFVRGLNPGTPSNPWRILDVAGGTGDIAFRMLDHSTKINRDSQTHVTVADINPEMLREGKKRASQSQYKSAGRLDFIEANAEKLHMIEDESLDLYTVAFGIRNFTDKPAALREAFRVLKPGGVFACLEFSKVNNALFNNIYKAWSFSAIPIIGQIVAGDRKSYQYLVESIEKFPSQEEFRRMIIDAGFRTSGLGYQNLNGGIAAIHKGIKPASRNN